MRRAALDGTIRPDAIEQRGIDRGVVARLVHERSMKFDVDM